LYNYYRENSDSMDEISILERIVAEEGSCCWAKPSVCAACPLGHLTRYESGNYMSCIESLNIDGLSEEDADARYKEAATRKLADIMMNNIIEAD
jgi:hypothetical protein